MIQLKPATAHAFRRSSREGIVYHRRAWLPFVGPVVVRLDQIARINIGVRYELVDLDGPRRVERDIFQLGLGIDVGVGIDFVSLHDLVGCNAPHSPKALVSGCVLIGGGRWPVSTPSG